MQQKETNTHNLPRQEPPPQRAVRDDLHPELAARLHHPVHLVLGLDVERDRRVLGLERGDGVHGVRAAEGARGDLGEAEVFDAAFSVGVCVS